MIDGLGKKVSSGSYGEIYATRLVKGRMEVAVKRLLVSECSDFGYSYQELDICLKFAKHSNICGATSVLYSSDASWSKKAVKGLRYDSISLILPLAKYDLYKLCGIEVLSEVMIKRITAQLLLALECLHKNRYIHRDIKPTNVLCYEGLHIKLCDYGLSKKYHVYEEHESPVATDHFRAPEVLRLVPVYDYGVDIWALGCTVYYMHTNNLPCPEWDKKNGRYDNIAQAQAIIDSLPYEVSAETLQDDPLGRHLDYTMKTDSDRFFSLFREDVKSIEELSTFLIEGMLMFDTRHRLSARQLLDHQYMTGVEASISRSRSSYSLDVLESPPTKLVSAREYYLDMAQDMHNKYSRLDWYRDKILFTSIEMMDRALASMANDHPDLEHKEVDVRTYYRTCLHISAKYYSACVSYDLCIDDFPFRDLNYSNKERAGEMERWIVEEVLRGRIYNLSIYDIAMNHHKPRDSDVSSMLDFVLSGSHNGLTPEQAYERWEDKQLSSL